MVEPAENTGAFLINGIPSPGDPLGLTQAIFKGAHAEQWALLMAENLNALNALNALND